MSFRYLSRNQISELTGKDRKTIKKRLEGLAPYSSDKRGSLYDVQLALPLVYGSTSMTELEKKLLEAQVENEQGKVRKINLENKKREGELVEVTKVSEIVEKEYAAVRAALLAIPNKMAHVLINVESPAEIKAKLEDTVNEALTELTAKTLSELEGVELTNEDDGASTEDIKASASESTQAQVKT